MEFFQYASYVNALTSQFNGTTYLWVSFLVGGLCFAIVYVFRSVGLFVIAGHEGLPNKWMAFVPFLSTYYIGVCGQKNRFFNIDTKAVGIVSAVLEVVMVALYVLDIVAFVSVEPFIVQTTEYYEYLGQQIPVTADTLNVQAMLAANPTLGWAGWCYNYLDAYIISWMQLLDMLVMVVLLNCFFQTYSARRYFLFTITSVLFPVEGILIFAVRNNKGMSYAEYTRMVQERMYREYRSQQNFDRNPYNNNPYTNGYDRPPYQNNPDSGNASQGNSNGSATDDPFGEYSSGAPKDDDPFDEFKN